MNANELDAIREHLAKMEIPANWAGDESRMIFGSYHLMKKAIEHIDCQAAQIATLKAALIESEAAGMALNGHADDELRAAARENLAREFPGIDWSEHS